MVKMSSREVPSKRLPRNSTTPSRGGVEKRLTETGTATDKEPTERTIPRVAGKSSKKDEHPSPTERGDMGLRSTRRDCKRIAEDSQEDGLGAAKKKKRKKNKKNNEVETSQAVHLLDSPACPLDVVGENSRDEQVRPNLTAQTTNEGRQEPVVLQNPDQVSSSQREPSPRCTHSSTPPSNRTKDASRPIRVTIVSPMVKASPNRATSAVPPDPFSSSSSVLKALKEALETHRLMQGTPSSKANPVKIAIRGDGLGAAKKKTPEAETSPDTPDGPLAIKEAVVKQSQQTKLSAPKRNEGQQGPVVFHRADTVTAASSPGQAPSALRRDPFDISSSSSVFQDLKEAVETHRLMQESPKSKVASTAAASSKRVQVDVIKRSRTSDVGLLSEQSQLGRTGKFANTVQLVPSTSGRPAIVTKDMLSKIKLKGRTTSTQTTCDDMLDCLSVNRDRGAECVHRVVVVSPDKVHQPHFRTPHEPRPTKHCQTRSEWSDINFAILDAVGNGDSETSSSSPRDLDSLSHPGGEEGSCEVDKNIQTMLFGLDLDAVLTKAQAGLPSNVFAGEGDKEKEKPKNAKISIQSWSLALTVPGQTV